MSSGTSCIVEQLGLAMMPSWSPASSGFTCDTTRGMPGSMRHCDELSMTTAPRATASGASTLETSPPAENSAMSTPSKASAVASWTAHSRPPKLTERPLAREASGRSSPTGMPRSASTVIIVCPTSPVAPTTATVSGRVMRVPLGRGDSVGMVWRAMDSIMASPMIRPGMNRYDPSEDGPYRCEPWSGPRPRPVDGAGQAGALAWCRCIAAFRDRFTRPWRSISMTTTMISSPTWTTSSTVGTW